jgi:diguanylate cyclase
MSFEPDPRRLQLFGSLRVRLAVAGIAALALGIAITTAVLLRRAEIDTLRSRERLERGEVVRAARLLSRHLASLQRALAATALQIGPTLPADDAALAREARAQAALFAQFDNLAISGPDGRVRYRRDAQGAHRPGVERTDDGTLRRLVGAGHTPVTDGLTGGTQPLVVFTQPLRRDGDMVGMLSTELRLRSRSLFAEVAESSQNDDSALVVVTDASGRILAHPDPARLGQPVAAEPRLAGALQRWRAAGRPIGPEGLNLGGPRQIVAAAGVAGSDWTVWRLRNRADLLQPLRAGRGEAMRWAAGVLVVFGALLLALLTWLLHPLARLQARAERLFDGSLAAQDGWPDVGGEIGRLTRVLRHVGAERAQLETFNHQVIQRLESVMAAAPVGIAFTRAQRFELVSRQFCALFRCTEDRLLGQPTRALFETSADYEQLAAAAAAAFADARAYDGEWQLLRSDGSCFWARLRGQPVDWKEPESGTIWTVHDITDEVGARRALEWAATHDALTGLANRPAFEARLARVFDALPRSLPAALVVFDLDRFKPVNDRHGHAAGDAMLREVAAAAVGCVRAGDLLVRLGGDEFALLLERCPAEVATRVAEQLRHAVASIRLPWEGQVLDIGASVGVAALDMAIDGPAAWLAAADRACYQAKKAGRGRVCVTAADAPTTSTH